MNIAEAFAAHALSRPGDAAVEDGERIVTWAELEALANRSAAHLTREGIAPGDIVALALPESVEYIALLWSLAWIGAVIFPINAELLRSEDEVGLGARQLKAALVGPSFPSGSRLCFAALFAGATVIIEQSKSAEELVLLLQEKRVTVTSLTPLHLRSLLEYGAGKELIFPSLRSLRVSTGAIAAVERDLARRHVTPNIIIVYGCNEQSWISATTPADQDAEPDSAGRLVAGVEAGIVDENHQPLPFGGVGLLRVRSDHTAAGYLNDPEADARAFQGGWFYPMDLAAINEDGYIFLKGRADDMISYDGIKFYPIEVENVLLSHPDVKEAAVFGWPHPLHGEVAMAAVTTGTPETSKTLKDFCLQRLAAYKAPQLVMRMAEMPRNPAGKILKRRLKERMRRKIDEHGGNG